MDSDPTRERRGPGKHLRERVRQVARVIAIAVGVAVLFAAGRVVLYRQGDDDDGVRRKRAYLESVAGLAADGRTAPNVVVILFDDLGYGDIGAYGGTAIRTPAIDRLAAEGVLFRNGYSASPYCSASRAGLLTGRYPVRAGLDHVVQAPWTFKDVMIRLGGWHRRLPAEEITLAEVLSAAGYATAIVGKWHLGDASPSLPQDLGFDSFFGLLYSNDQGKPVVWDGRNVVERHPIDQTTLTRRYTDRAVAFIETNHERPFFLYLAHTFPHVPLHASADRLGTSDAGLYGDVVEELDASVGAVIEALERIGDARDTLVVVTSDNGPWFQGSPGRTRGRKFDVFEGGMRVPFVVRWRPGSGGGRVVDDPVIGIDLFPTVLELAEIPPPGDRIIDGRSFVAALEADRPFERGPIYFHQFAVLRAVRDGRFKYHDRHRVPYGNPMNWVWGPMRDRGPWLFDLALDPDESYDVSARRPETVRRLREILEARRRELDANPRGWL